MERTFRRWWDRYERQFRANPRRDAQRYLLVVLTGLVLTLVCFFQPLVLPCGRSNAAVGNWTVGIHYRNPMYDDSVCRRSRFAVLLGLSPWEADLGRRILSAMVLGAILGQERRAADRPAGIRTNACVAIGASCFTVCSMFAFESGYFHYDASRSAAMIPQGVTFLSSAIIAKVVEMRNGKKVERSYGIITAATVWVAAAIGTATGGALYWAAFLCSLAVIVINRMGPMLPPKAS